MDALHNKTTNTRHDGGDGWGGGVRLLDKKHKMVESGQVYK